MEINLIIFKAINGLVHQSMVLDKFMIFMSKFAPDIFIFVLAFIYLMGLVRKNSKMRGISIDTFIIIVLSLFAGYVIGAIWYVPRPFVNNKVNLIMPHTVDASFPSDHAIGTMGIGIGISKYNRICGGILIALSVLVGLSRVYVGHHYPSDVLGGYALVFIISYLYNGFLKNRVQTIYFKVEQLLAKKYPVLKQFL